jgi:hypothetical protein
MDIMVRNLFWFGKTASGAQHISRVSRTYVIGTPAGGQGSKAVGVACLESTNWVRVILERVARLSV